MKTPTVTITPCGASFRLTGDTWAVVKTLRFWRLRSDGGGWRIDPWLLGQLRGLAEYGHVRWVEAKE